MKFLEYLYFKYYCFQVKVGNKDVAPFIAMLIIVFIILIYYLSAFFFTITIFHKFHLFFNIKFFKLFTFVLITFLIIWLYFLLVYNGKYKKIRLCFRIMWIC